MSAPSETSLLSVTGLSKTFPPAIRALAEASFELRAGEVHALLGENGAGKSTLSRIIAGITTPDSGEMRLLGHPYRAASRREAERQGVRIVTQELNLVSTLTVAENIFLDRMPNRLGWIDRRGLNEKARELLKRVGLTQLDPETRIADLRIAQQQLVEIASGLSGECRVLILDEPTAALAQHEIELLFQQITQLKSEGVGIIYISHRLEEISRICDRMTILRDGKVVGTAATRATTRADIIKMMVGRELGAASGQDRGKSGPVAMRVEGLRAGRAVQDVSFEVHRGEILGFAGLMGSGRTETMRAIFGADPKEAGNIYLHGDPTPVAIQIPSDATRAGIALLTEDRKGEGLLLPWPVRQNVSLTAMTKVKRAWGWISRQRERETAEDYTQRLRIRCSSVEQTTRDLSGGNQQKVVIAKWLHRDCDVLIFDEPTRGIDIGAKFEIYQLLAELAGRGKAIIVVSSDLPELLAVCHRIAVLSAGRLVRTFDASEFDQDRIMTAALSNY